MHFKILQGLDVTSKKALLHKVYKGEYRWKEMEHEASIIKAQVKVLAALMELLKKNSVNKLMELVGKE
jgi:hypothetical protein